jgi:PadR family transcriptional regulator AphA
MTRPIEYPVDRDPAHLRAAYFEWVDPRVAREQLEAHIAHFEGLRAVRLAQLVSIRDHTHPIVRRRLESADPDRARRLVAFKAFTYEGFVELAECEIAWAKRGIRLLDELAAEERTRPDEARD